MPVKPLKQVSAIQKHIPHKIDYVVEKSISYSQLQQYTVCPHQWSLNYVKGLLNYKPSIHTVFGTALHETLQEWLHTVYNVSAKKANEMNLEDLLKNKLKSIYSSEKEKLGEHFTTSEQLAEFYSDGIDIINYIKKKRAVYFNTKYLVLVGVEVPLVFPLTDRIYFKGYIDGVFYDKVEDKYLILDIKTSTTGWSSYAKKDDTKLAQVLLYKEFLAKQFNLDVDKIEVKYFIVKRKVPDDAEYPAMMKRVQEFIPPSGKIKRGQALVSVKRFLEDAFTPEGKYLDKEYEKRPSKSNCKFCDYKNTSHCPVGIF